MLVIDFGIIVVAIVVFGITEYLNRFEVEE